jgi:hypothetical protein
MDCANCLELGNVRIDADTFACEDCFNLYIVLNSN